jgi:hypothetical protein
MTRKRKSTTSEVDKCESSAAKNTTVSSRVGDLHCTARSDRVTRQPWQEAQATIKVAEIAEEPKKSTQL